MDKLAKKEMKERAYKKFFDEVKFDYDQSKTVEQIQQDILQRWKDLDGEVRNKYYKMVQVVAPKVEIVENIEQDWTEVDKEEKMKEQMRMEMEDQSIQENVEDIYPKKRKQRQQKEPEENKPMSLMDTLLAKVNARRKKPEKQAKEAKETKEPKENKQIIKFSTKPIIRKPKVELIEKEHKQDEQIRNFLLRVSTMDTHFDTAEDTELLVKRTLQLSTYTKDDWNELPEYKRKQLIIKFFASDGEDSFNKKRVLNNISELNKKLFKKFMEDFFAQQKSYHVFYDQWITSPEVQKHLYKKDKHSKEFEQALIDLLEYAKTIAIEEKIDVDMQMRDQGLGQSDVYERIEKKLVNDQNQKEKDEEKDDDTELKKKRLETEKLIIDADIRKDAENRFNDKPSYYALLRSIVKARNPDHMQLLDKDTKKKDEYLTKYAVLIHDRNDTTDLLGREEKKKEYERKIEKYTKQIKEIEDYLADQVNELHKEFAINIIQQGVSLGIKDASELPLGTLVARINNTKRRHIEKDEHEQDEKVYEKHKENDKKQLARKLARIVVDSKALADSELKTDYSPNTARQIQETLKLKQLQDEYMKMSLEQLIDLYDSTEREISTKALLIEEYARLSGLPSSSLDGFSKQELLEKIKDFKCINARKSLNLFNVDRTQVYIYGQYNDIRNFTDTTVKKSERNNEQWFPSNDNFDRLLCSNVERSQNGDVFSIQFLKLKVGYLISGNFSQLSKYGKRVGKVKLDGVSYPILSKTGEKDLKDGTTTAFVIQDEELFNQISRELNKNTETVLDKIDVIGQKNINDKSLLVASINLSNSLSRISNNSNYAPHTTKYIQTLVSKIKELHPESNKIFMTAVADILVYLDMKDARIFRERVSAEYYTPEILPLLSPSDKLPEIFDNDLVSPEEVESTVKFITWRKNALISRLLQHLYMTEHNTERRNMTNVYDNSLDLKISENIHTKRLQQCQNPKDVKGEKSGNVLFYKENGNIYCFSIPKLNEQFSMKNYINPKTGNTFNQEFINHFERIFNVKQQKDQGNGDKAEELKEQNKEKKDKEPDVIPGLWKLIKDSVDALEFEDLFRDDEDEEGDTEEEDEEQKQHEEDEEDSEFGFEMESDLEKDLTAKQSEKAESKSVEKTENVDTTKTEPVEKIEKVGNNNDSKSNFGFDDKKCSECDQTIEDNVNLASVNMQNGKPVHVKFCSFDCFEKHEFKK